MEMNMVLFIYGAVVLGWLIALTGVALGGWLVFRTKREHYDGLFTKHKDGSAEAFNMDELGEKFGADVPEKILESVLNPGGAEPTNPSEEAMARLQNQFFGESRVNDIAEAAVAATKKGEANSDELNPK